MQRTISKKYNLCDNISEQKDQLEQGQFITNPYAYQWLQIYASEGKIDGGISFHSHSQLHVMLSQFSIPSKTLKERYLKWEMGQFCIKRQNLFIYLIVGGKKLGKQCSRISGLPQ